MSSNHRQSAWKFREYWTFQRGSEKGEDQQFWNSLLRDVLGVADVECHIQYQVPVPMAGTTKFLDAWIPETHVLIEHKSRGVKLDAPHAGHGNKTPFQQALEYNQARGFSEKARWIVTCNFDEIWVYDMDQPLSEPQKIRLAAYGLKPDTPEPEIVAHLFKLYAEAVKETKGTEVIKGKRAKERSRSLKSLQSLTSLEGETNG